MEGERNYRTEMQIVCNKSGERPEQAAIGSGWGGINAWIQTEARQLVVVCVWGRQSLGCRAEEDCAGKWNSLSLLF